MTVGDALRALARTADAVEERGIDVEEAVPVETGEDEVVADLRVRVPLEETAAPGAGAAVEPAEGTTTGPALSASTSGPADAGIERSATRPAGTDVDSDATGDGSDAADPGPVEPAAGPAEPNVRPDRPDIEPDGRHDGPDASEADPDEARDVDATDAAEGDDDDGEAGDATGDGPPVDCTVEGCDERFDTEHGMRIHRSKTHDASAPDRETLASVYASEDSFAAMRDALDVDVSVQTVRRWMIDRDVHAPGVSSRSDGDDAGDPVDAATDATAADDPDADDRPESPGDGRAADGAGPVDADGGDGTTDRAAPAFDVDLPASVTPRDLREAVEEATTLYQVQRRLDLDRDETRELLAEAGLLELVHGRVADQDRREELKRDLEERFAASAGDAGAGAGPD